MHAIRKRDLKYFTPDSKSICRIDENSTNDYIKDDPRAIERFLATIEPNYNRAVSSVARGRISSTDIFVIAGFIAYINTCSPAAMRFSIPHLKAMIEETAFLLDQQKELPEPPPTLEGESITKLLREGKIEIGVDPKYPQAVGIKSIFSLIGSYGNFDWEILHNRHLELPFITSDFPLVAQATRDPRVLIRIFPLSPYLAVKLIPKIGIPREELNLEFKHFRFCCKKLKKKEVRSTNRLIAQCAEDLILSSRDSVELRHLAETCAGYRLESKEYRLPSGNGKMLISRLSIEENTAEG